VASASLQEAIDRAYPKRGRGTKVKATRSRSLREAINRLPTPDADEFVTHTPRPKPPAKSDQHRGGHGVGGFLKNLAGDALDVVTGSGGFLSLVGRTAAAPAVAAYGGVAHATGLPGGSASMGFVKHVGSDWKRAGEAAVADVKDRYGRLAHGDFGVLYEHPGLFILDAASIATGGASAAAKAARLGQRFVRPGSKIHARLVRVGKSTRLEARERPDRVIERQVTEGAAAGSKVRVSIPQRPLARTPVGRAVQKPLLRANAAVLDAVGRVVHPLSREARDSRAFTKHFRRLERAADDARLADFAKATEGYAVASRKLKSGQERAALALHLRGLSMAAGNHSGHYRLQQAIKSWERGLAEAEAKYGKEAMAEARKQLKLVKSLPRELVELNDPSNPAVARVLRAAEEAKALDASVQSRAVEAGYIDEATRARRQTHAQDVLIHGAELHEDLGVLAHPEAAAELIKRHGQFHPHAGRVAVWVKREFGARRRGRKLAGPTSLQGQLELAVARELLDEGAVRTTRDGWLDRRTLLKDVATALEKRGAGKIPVDANGKVIRSVLEQRALHDPKVRALLDDRSLRQAPGEASATAIHMSDLPIGFMSRKQRLKAERGLGSSQRPKRSLGELLRSGDVSLSPAVPLKQASDVIGFIHSRNWVKDVAETWALRDKYGTVLTGKRSDVMRGLNPDHWVPVSLGQFEAALRELGELPEGKVIRGNPFSVDDTRSDVIVLPREIANEIQFAFKNPRALTRHYDSAMAMWRAGILAFTPRWYLNNVFGVSLMYGLASGLDVRSLLRARKQAFKRVIPHEISSASHSRDAGALVAESWMDDATGLMERVQAAAHRGFTINESMERLWRDAAYLSLARRTLRNEGRLARNKLRDTVTRSGRRLQDEQLIEAIANAPMKLKQEILREAEFFMGDFRRFSRVEKTILRRIFPFWSWIRVINTLAFGLPFKSPLRAKALTIASQMGAELQGDTSYLPLWERGRFKLGSSIAMRTSGLNPLQSVAEELASMGAPGDVRGAVTDLLRVGGGMTTPPLQIAIAQVSGRNPFGTREFSAPPDFAGTSSQYGRGRVYLNPVTGSVERYSPTPNIGDQIVEAIPYVPALRQILAGDRRPYDTSGLYDQVLEKLGVKSASDVYQPPEDVPRGRGPIPYVSPISSLLGVPIYRVNESQERWRDVLDRRALVSATRQSKRQRLKEEARRRRHDNR
jgi:hypothetical protein